MNRKNLANAFTLTSSRQTTTSQESTQNRIPRVLLLSVPLHRTVKRTEHTTPDTEISAENGCTGLDGGQGTGKPFSSRRCSCAFDTMPDLGELKHSAIIG